MVSPMVDSLYSRRHNQTWKKTGVKKTYILMLVEIVLIIRDGGTMILVMIMVFPLMDMVAVVVVFRGLYFGSKVDCSLSPAKVQVPFMVVTSVLFAGEKFNTKLWSARNSISEFPVSFAVRSTIDAPASFAYSAL